MVLAGRSAERLDAARAAALEAGGEVVRTAAAGVDDPEALIGALAGTRAVVNAAGPFVRTGAPVLRAAIAAGVHYVDTTGEQPWIRETFERFDDDLRAAGVAAVAGMGFDYVPGDLLCHLVGARAEPLSELVVAYDIEGFDPTRGTMRSSLEMMRRGLDVVFEDGTWVTAGDGPRRARFTFPEPNGRRVVAKYPSGEQITVPRHVRTRRVVSLISTRSVAPPQLEGALPLLTPAISTLLNSPLRERLDERIGDLPEGPPEDRRRAARWTIACIARGEDGREARGIVRGPDVYGLTAVTAVHGALLLAQGGVSGAHAPATAFDARAFLAHLEPFGVRLDPPA
jgi:short subunit dehydrogenase-like uncharacterized protein